MMCTNYAMRRATRLAEAGAPERAYMDMRRTLEHHLQLLPPQTGRFVAVLTGEERLREALSQRVTLQQVLDVMEQRWPYTGQRMSLVRQIAAAVGTEQLRAALDDIQVRYGLTRPAAAAAPVPPSPGPPSSGPPSTLRAEAGWSTQESLPRPSYLPPARVEGPINVEERREIVISCLSSLTRSQGRDLAFQLRMTVGCVEDLDRASGSGRELVRRMLEEYFNTPLLHRGDQIGTLIRAIRGLNLNMTADRLEQSLGW